MRKTTKGTWIFLWVILAVIVGLSIWGSVSYNRQACIEQVEENYWKYVELNSTDSKPGENDNTIYTASPIVWTIADTKKEVDIDRCYK